MKKNLATLIMALVLTFALVGCGKKAEKVDDTIKDANIVEQVEKSDDEKEHESKDEQESDQDEVEPEKEAKEPEELEEVKKIEIDEDSLSSYKVPFSERVNTEEIHLNTLILIKKIEEKYGIDVEDVEVMNKWNSDAIKKLDEVYPGSGKMNEEWVEKTIEKIFFGAQKEIFGGAQDPNFEYNELYKHLILSLEAGHDDIPEYNGKKKVQATWPDEIAAFVYEKIMTGEELTDEKLTPDHYLEIYQEYNPLMITGKYDIWKDLKGDEKAVVVYMRGNQVFDDNSSKPTHAALVSTILWKNKLYDVVITKDSTRLDDPKAKVHIESFQRHQGV